MAQLQMAFVFENPQFKSLSQMFIANKGIQEVNSTYNPYDTSDFNPISYFGNLQNNDNPYFFNQLDSLQFETNDNLRRLSGL
jgi:hypothetical protein